MTCGDPESAIILDGPYLDAPLGVTNGDQKSSIGCNVHGRASQARRKFLLINPAARSKAADDFDGDDENTLCRRIERGLDVNEAFLQRLYVREVLVSTADRIKRPDQGWPTLLGRTIRYATKDIDFALGPDDAVVSVPGIRCPIGVDGLAIVRLSVSILVDLHESATRSVQDFPLQIECVKGIDLVAAVRAMSPTREVHGAAVESRSVPGIQDSIRSVAPVRLRVVLFGEQRDRRCAAIGPSARLKVAQALTKSCGRGRTRSGGGTRSRSWCNLRTLSRDAIARYQVD